MDRVGVSGRFVGDIPSTFLSILYYGGTKGDHHPVCCNSRVPWLGEGGREGELADLPAVAYNGKRQKIRIRRKRSLVTNLTSSPGFPHSTWSIQRVESYPARFESYPSRMEQKHIRQMRVRTGRFAIVPSLNP